MTSYQHRLKNLPVVLDTIFAQTKQPDLVVLNLAYEESIPGEVQNYLDEHCVEINRVEDTKVYKKLIPTLKRHPNDCIITIDDDFLYPLGMIEDFMRVHHHYPDYPISGNREFYLGLQCHCGCASLMKAEFLGGFINMIDNDVIDNCPSDDIVYTYFANKNGHPYIRTHGLYFTNMQSYQEGEGYSDSIGTHAIMNSYNYLVRRFGQVDFNLNRYIKDEGIEIIVKDYVRSRMSYSYFEGCNKVRSTYSYRIGHFLLGPIRMFYSLFPH